MKIYYTIAFALSMGKKETVAGSWCYVLSLHFLRISNQRKTKHESSKAEIAAITIYSFKNIAFRLNLSHLQTWFRFSHVFSLITYIEFVMCVWKRYIQVLSDVVISLLFNQEILYWVSVWVIHYLRYYSPVMSSDKICAGWTI